MTRTSACPEPTSQLGPALGDRERRFVYAVALRYVKAPDAADDVAQEALLLAHRHRQSFRGDARYSTWLYRIAATAALMHLRKRRRIERGEARPERADDDQTPRRVEPVDLTADPAERCAARERLADIETKLAALGAKYREVFWMRFGAGMTDGEVAEALGVGLSTIKTRTHRTRRALRGVLAA